MNRRYPKWNEALQQGKLGAALTGNVRVMLVDLDSYKFSAKHEFLKDIDALARVAVSDPLNEKSFKNGVFDAADIRFYSVIGKKVGAIVLYVDQGSPAVSRLVDYFDSGVAGLPLVPNGTDVEIHWNSRGIHAL